LHLFQHGKLLHGVTKLTEIDAGPLEHDGLQRHIAGRKFVRKPGPYFLQLAFRATVAVR
jgi:hypothetical protein